MHALTGPLRPLLRRRGTTLCRGRTRSKGRRCDHGQVCDRGSRPQLAHSTQAVSGTRVALSVRLALIRQPVTTPFVTIGSLAVMTPGDPPPVTPALNTC